jgi:tetratricopeptide (TPR) repeat protein
LISESSAIFEKLGLKEKAAEAHVDLGICYWRAGALDEARITFDAALQQLGDLESTQRLRALLNKALIEEVSSRPKEALRILSASEPLFELSSNHALRGKFHNEFGTVLKNLGLAERREDYIDRSLMQYTAASVELEQAGLDRGLASVENNLGFLFIHLGRFEEAHHHLERALAKSRQLNDRGLRAQVEDTRARAFIAQGLYDLGEKIASSAVRALRDGDEQVLLAEALITGATALAKLGRTDEALANFKEAATVASQAGDPEGAGIAFLAIVEELSSSLSPAESKNYYLRAESALKHSQRAAVRYRLGECARTLLTDEPHTSTTATTESVASGTLEEQVLRYEAELISRALQASDGSVTRAARMLGITHQGLAFILNGRQKNLLSSRKPAKPRRRSIIRYH